MTSTRSSERVRRRNATFQKGIEEGRRLQHAANGWQFQLGDQVHKPSGSWWAGRVVGTYSTEQTPRGYCVQLDSVRNGPVQLYPEAALAACTTACSDVIAAPEEG